jgi:hypothetical protein
LDAECLQIVVNLNLYPHAITPVWIRAEDARRVFAREAEHGRRR